jgi:hypothetical protein
VIGKATRQVRDTLRYLTAYSEILVPNERGHMFNLAASAFVEVLKIVIYMPSSNLPNDCRNIRRHVSKSAGFIHIIDARDYLELARTLRVPEEVVRYLHYREAVLTRLEQDCVNVPEPAIAGHFIGGNLDVVPTAHSATHLHRLIQDETEWDLGPFLRDMHDHITVSGDNYDYYRILLEFSKLPRSAWRVVKERIRLCIEKVQNEQFAQPYRVTYPSTGCGFVFIPVEAEFVRKPDWPQIRLRAI